MDKARGGDHAVNKNLVVSAIMGALVATAFISAYELWAAPPRPQAFHRISVRCSEPVYFQYRSSILDGPADVWCRPGMPAEIREKESTSVIVLP